MCLQKVVCVMEITGDIQYIWSYDNIGKAILIVYLFNRKVAGKIGICHRCGGGSSFILFDDFIYRSFSEIYN